MCTLGKDSVFVTGGSDLVSQDTCEIFSFKTNSWKEIYKLKKGRKSHSMCTFNKRYIYVFHGVHQSSSGSSVNEDTIERLDTYNMHKKWTKVQFMQGFEKRINDHKPIFFQISFRELGKIYKDRYSTIDMRNKK